MANKKGKWRARLSKDDYLVMAAIRGPDSAVYCAGYLKDITAGVIRWYAGLSPYAGAAVCSPEEAQKIWKDLQEETRRDIRGLVKEEAHYTRHFLYAMEALARLECPGALEYLAWFKATLLSWGKA